ncbi:hypothetical protein AAC387_Pa10g0748 [Persea americana]
MAASPSNSPLFISICRIADVILLVFFIFISVVAPLIDAQTCISSRFFPHVLVDVKSQYGREYGDFLMVEKPGFFVGVVWMELLFQWPLAIANAYGILRKRSWYTTTCLMYGVSTCTGMAAILGELVGSDKASNKLLMMYLPFLGISIMAILRGLVSCPSSTPVNTARKRKKRA